MTYKILAVNGSLREASLHKKLLLALPALAPEDVEIILYELHDIPLFNEDIKGENGELPEAVQTFIEAIESADGILWATPEYNGSMTGVLKNAIDWASVKGLAKIPTAPITGSPGALGATKGQEALRMVLNHLGMYVMPRPSIAIPKLYDKFNADGQIEDEMTEKFVGEFLISFRNWIVQLQK